MTHLHLHGVVQFMLPFQLLMLHLYFRILVNRRSLLPLLLIQYPPATPLQVEALPLHVAGPHRLPGPCLGLKAAGSVAPSAGPVAAVGVPSFAVPLAPADVYPAAPKKSHSVPNSAGRPGASFPTSGGLLLVVAAAGEDGTLTVAAVEAGMCVHPKDCRYLKQSIQQTAAAEATMLGLSFCNKQDDRIGQAKPQSSNLCYQSCSSVSTALSVQLRQQPARSNAHHTAKTMSQEGVLRSHLSCWRASFVELLKT